MSKVLIVGLDGASPDLIWPWVQEGKLPALQRLIQSGTWGPLESTIPPMTSPAWPSFATGKFPAKHGVFDFVSAHSGTFNVINATAIDARTLWDILSAQGKQVGVINVPVTYPPHPVNGFMITGLLSPALAKVTYPDDLLSRYESELGLHYRVMPTIQYKPGNEEAFIHDLEDLIDQRARFASHLMCDRPWDFMMVHFLATDLIQHALWRFMDPAHPRHEANSPYREAILRIYQRVDVALGKLLSQVPEDTTVIAMSDHGFGPLYGVVNLNVLLWERGLLRLKRSPLAMLRAFTFRHGLTPALAYNLLAKLNLQNVISRVSKSTRNAVFNKFLSFEDVDWNRTVAYSLGHMGQIYINLKGREPHGIVERDGHSGTVRDYDRAIAAVIEALQSLKTLDGRPMLDRAIRSDELPGGEHAEDGPDLHVVLDGYRYISCPLFATDGHVLSKQIRGDSGCHRMHGLLIISGPNVHAGRQVQGARIVDLAPTALHLMGCPIPGDMDGRVLTEVLDAAFLDERLPQVEPVASGVAQDAFALTADEEAELEARLKGLGYLG
jgi:predicted AlkP superfamily phosphohydrolase/phosphomutase